MSLLAGCQSLPPRDAARAGAGPAATAHDPGTYSPSSGERAPGEHAAASAPPPDDLWERLALGLAWDGVDNAAVARERARFVRQRNHLPRVGERAALYLHYIVDTVEARGLPLELALLPMVESTLDPFATSPSQAAGLWQIMPATGRQLGLRQDWWYDGRRALRASTTAALDYLEALHAAFEGDWLLALAAYNAGQGRVERAMAANARRGLPTDYWSLRLPRETRHYVPRLLALAQLVRAPRHYGLTLPPVDNRPAFEVAATGGQIDIARAAALAAVESATLRALNPGQLRWATAPDGPDELLLPVGTRAQFEAGLATLTPAERVQWQRYRIQRGDALLRIARRFGTEVDVLRQVNGIHGSHIRAGDTLMIPLGAASLSPQVARTAGQPRAYRVRPGDSLYRIAGRFKVSIDDLIAWNALDPEDYLQPGQTLRLHAQGG